MNQLQKIAAYIVILGLLVMMAAACNNKKTKDLSADNSKPVTLTLWQGFGSGHEADYINEIIKQYKEVHPNVTIQQTAVTDNTKILTAISGGNPPDVISLGGSAQMGEWAAKGVFTDLTPYINSDSSFNQNAFIKSGWDTGVYNGKVYGLPFINFNFALLYNKRLFQEAGIDHPPATLEELAHDAELLTKVDSSGKIVQMGFVPGQLPLLALAFGGKWVDESGKATADHPANIAALEWEKSFYDKYGAQNITNFVKSGGPAVTADDLWESEKVAMVIDGPWNIPYSIENKAKVADHMGTAPIPATADHAKLIGTSIVDTNPLVIPTGSKHPNEAWQFINWLANNSKIAGEFATVTSAFPHLKGVTNYKLGEDPLIKVFVDEADSANAQVWPVTSASMTYFSKIGEAEQNVLNDNKNPAEELKRVSDEVNKLLAGKK